jgi:hypothetical protein
MNKTVCVVLLCLVYAACYRDDDNYDYDYPSYYRRHRRGCLRDYHRTLCKDCPGQKGNTFLNLPNYYKARDNFAGKAEDVILGKMGVPDGMEDAFKYGGDKLVENYDFLTKGGSFRPNNPFKIGTGSNQIFNSALNTAHKTKRTALLLPVIFGAKYAYDNLNGL